METKKLTYAMAMKDYFGLRDGQTLQGFMVELRALTDADKQWFRENLPKVGYEIIAS